MIHDESEEREREQTSGRNGLKGESNTAKQEKKDSEYLMIEDTIRSRKLNVID